MISDEFIQLVKLVKNKPDLERIALRSVVGELHLRQKEREAKKKKFAVVWNGVKRL